jgi:lipopolysaccharide export system permease protein
VIFHSALVRELRATAWATFATLLTIVLSTTLIRILDQASTGRSDPSLVVPLIALSSVSSLTLVVSLTAFLTILIVLGRWWRESEMVVWLSSGVSLWGLARPVAQFVWPFVLMSAFCALVLSPWARGQMDDVTESFQNRSDVQRVSPGQFRESASGQRVFFVEMLDESSVKLGKVFSVSTGQENRTTVLNGRSGEIITDDQGRSWIRVSDGTRTDFTAQPDRFHQGLQTMRFESYEVRSDLQAAIGGPDNRGLRSVSTLTLLASPMPHHEGELAFRMGAPLLALALAFLAIPLAYVGQRTARWYPLLFALLIVVLSNNLLSVTKAWISSEQLAFWWGWWPLPLGVMLFYVLLMWMRAQVRRMPWEILSYSLHARGIGFGRRSSRAKDPD